MNYVITAIFHCRFGLRLTNNVIGAEPLGLEDQRVHMAEQNHRCILLTDFSHSRLPSRSLRMLTLY